MTDYIKIKERFEPQKAYSYGEVLKKISSQSSTASYIFQDMLLAGYFQPLKERKFRINI